MVVIIEIYFHTIQNVWAVFAQSAAVVWQWWVPAVSSSAAVINPDTLHFRAVDWAPEQPIRRYQSKLSSQSEDTRASWAANQETPEQAEQPIRGHQSRQPQCAGQSIRRHHSRLRGQSNKIWATHFSGLAFYASVLFLFIFSDGSDCLGIKDEMWDSYGTSCSTSHCRPGIALQCRTAGGFWLSVFSCSRR